MFWRFGGYGNVSTIDNILERENFQLEELLDDGELVQELKAHNAKLVEYLRGPEVLEKLLSYVVAPKLEPVAAPDDDEDEDADEKGKGIALPFTRSRSSSSVGGTTQEDSEKKRNRYAFIATEILSSETWSMYEALMDSKPLLRSFWQFLKRDTPLDPLQASYFTKVNESLFDKKTEEMIDLLKSMDGAVSDILRHVDCPMIMDLLLKIISLERTESGQGIVEWLYTQDVMPTLISFLGPEHSWATQTSAADFIKAIITVSANASQNEQTCIGPNELTRQLVSRPCIDQLIHYMLGGGNPLTCGVGIVIEVIRKNNSDYDPEGVDINAPPSSRDPIYLGTLLRLFAEHVPDFMNLILDAPAQKQQLSSTFGDRIEPLGFDRFKTCELMAELLHCSNMMLLNEAGAEDIIAVRDAQRQRLRAEGRLLPVGIQEPMPMEDASMQASRFSVADEGRKLEVMNVSADDDGFEELSPTSSLIDKVEANFPDETLGSPKLNAETEGDLSEQQAPFEDIDLVVAPLSPNKKASQTTEGGDTSKGMASKETTEGDKSLEQKSDSGTPEQTQMEPKTQQPPNDSAGASTSPEQLKDKTDERSNPIGNNPLPAENPIAPSTETPAPSTLGENAPLAPEQKPAEPSPADTPSPQVPAPPMPETSTESSIEKTEPPQSEGPNAERAEQTADTPAAGPAGEPSNPGADAPTNVKPVVGDYLKMQFVEHRVVPTILSFFFKYPWNNFLHNVVYDIVQQVFNGPMDRGYNPTLAISLFEAADITNQIINGQRASEKSQAESKTRMGYMGHLTLIAEEVVKFTERNPPELVSELVLERVMDQSWVDYVEGALAETRERDNAILGGVRPEVAMSNRANAQSLMASQFAGLSSIGLGAVTSSALAEAGLNGGSDVAEGSDAGGAGPFAISAGTLMSGFGSSSDEDDDEEQDTEEDVNNEFRAYTDPLNANSNSMNPPSIPPPPPPPPPLNIPPSRARLQLAARLAMNKRNAAAATAAANGGEEGSSSKATDDTAGAAALTNPSTTSSERIRNPFADYDDDEDNSGSGSDEGENVEGDDLGMNTGSSGWNRGSWWRGMVRSARGRGHRRAVSDDMEQEVEVERFGDGRDDDSSDEEGTRRIRDDDIDDEEFGDFAMPEVEERVGGGGGFRSGIDPDRESVLVKPMPLHPTATTLKSTVSPFSSLWPFSREKREDDAALTEGASSTGPAITEEPVELAAEEETILGEDGKKIDRAVEATRRTSIEDPDEDEVDIGEEIIVHRAAGAR